MIIHYNTHIWIACIFLSGLQAFASLVTLNYSELFFYVICASEQEKESKLFQWTVNHPAIKPPWFLTAPVLNYCHVFPGFFVVYQMAQDRMRTVKEWVKVNLP